MAWKCPRCGNQNEGGLFNFCKKCGSTPPRGPSAQAGEPNARGAPPGRREAPPRREPQVRTSAARAGGGRRSGGGGRILAVLVVLVVVLAASGAIVALVSRVDVDEALRDLTGTDEPTLSAASVDDPVAATAEPLAEVPADEATTGPADEEPPAATGPAVAPSLAVARPRDVRCANRWNGAQNARARRAVVRAAEGARLFAGVQQATATTSGLAGGPALAGVCVVIVGTQPDPTTDALRPGDVYAEAGPVSGKRRPFVRLATVSLSYQWNARVDKAGRIVPRRGG